ncbi:hypothetical protein [Terriglobus sp.]|uniref:hypothetical protein n=1 Tax=Terriglobus sp. TaxID=1889013 RepID=UPI003B005E5E
MRLLPYTSRAIAFAAVLCAVPALHAAKKAPPAPDASTVAARDTHEKDKVTVAAEPFDTRGKADFFRNDYVGHSILPIRLFVKNDSDTPLDLSDVRIQFIAADGTKLPAATPDELNRRLFRFKDIQPRHIPGTPITYHSTPVDKKILDDDKDFSFTETTVAPHATATGFLFYDTRDLDDPVLRHAEIYLKQAHFADAKHTELFAFSVPLEKYVDAEKAAKAAAAKDSPAQDTDGIHGTSAKQQNGKF